MEILDRLIRTKRVRTLHIDEGVPVDVDFDEESGGGILSRDSLKAALTPYMPFRQDTEGVDLDATPGVLPPESEDQIIDVRDEDEEGDVPEEALIVADDFALDPKPCKKRGQARRSASPASASRVTSKARTKATAAKAKSKAKSTTTKPASKLRPRAKAMTAKRTFSTAKANSTSSKPPPSAARGSRKPRVGASTINPPPPDGGSPNEMRSRLRSYKS